MILTQQELATLLEVSFEALNRWESMKVELTNNTKRKLALLFERYEIIVED